MSLNHDIALIELQGCLDPLQNIKAEIGVLRENKELCFYTLESGCFVRKCCHKKVPNSNMKIKCKQSNSLTCKQYQLPGEQMCLDQHNSKTFILFIYCKCILCTFQPKSLFNIFFNYIE